MLEISSSVASARVQEAPSLFVMTKILLTTTSFQDTPGEHHKLLADTGWEVIRARGPLNEADTLAAVGVATSAVTT
jgi:hypothetical protein